MEIKAKTNCPLDGFKPCRELECAWFLKISGKNPQTGQDVDDWGCSMSWLPIILIENAKVQKSTSVAVESFRNEMVKSNETSQQILVAAASIPQKRQEFILENKE